MRIGGRSRRCDHRAPRTDGLHVVLDDVPRDEEGRIIGALPGVAADLAAADPHRAHEALAVVFGFGADRHAPGFDGWRRDHAHRPRRPAARLGEGAPHLGDGPAIERVIGRHDGEPRQVRLHGSLVAECPVHQRADRQELGEVVRREIVPGFCARERVEGIDEECLSQLLPRLVDEWVREGTGRRCGDDERGPDYGHESRRHWLDQGADRIIYPASR